MTASLPFALGAMALVLGGWLHYLAAIPKERVPARPRAHQATMATALLLAAAAVALGAPGPDVASLVVALVATGLSLFFFYLLAQAPLPDGALAVAVGDALPLIELKDSDGRLGRSADWRGRRVLLKFFRGHW